MACSLMRTARFSTTPEAQVDFEPPGTENARGLKVHLSLKGGGTSRAVAASSRPSSVPGGSKSTCPSGVVGKRAVLIGEQAVEAGPDLRPRGVEQSPSR